MVETTSEEQNKVKRMKRTVDSLRGLWDNIKCTNIRIIGVPEEVKKKSMRKFLKKLELKISPIWKRKESIKSKRQKESPKTHTNQTNKD